MSSLAGEYCDQLKHNFRTFYAPFPPNLPLQLGDYGVMNGNTFVPIGQVTDLAVPIGLIRRVPERASDFEFTSEGSVDVEFHAGGNATPTGVPIKAGLDISFSKKYAVFFTAVKCVPAFIQDQVSLGNLILQRLQEGRWQKKFVVVTSLLEAASSTIVVSASSQSSIGLEASVAGVPAIDLGDVGLKLSVKSARSVGFKAITQGGLTPLIGLSKVSGVFDDSFNPFAAHFEPFDISDGTPVTLPERQLLPFTE